MTPRLVTLLAATSLITAGCWDPVLSLHPLYNRDQTIYDPALVGTWEDEEGKPFLTFVGADSSYYELKVHGDGGDSVRHILDAHLVELEGERFLDCFPVGQSESDECYNEFVIPAHYFLHVRRMEPTLELGYLDNTYDVKMEVALLEPPLPYVPYTSVGGTFLLTACTEDLQMFLPLCVRDSTAFEYMDEMSRQAEATD